MTSAADLRWSWVGRSMWAGAIYDLAFAAAMFVFPAAAARILRLELPPDLVYLRFNGVFLVMLAATYVLAAREPRRYRAIVVIAAAGRLLGFFYLVAAWWTGRPVAFLWLGIADLTFSIAHAWLLQRASRAAV